MADSLSAESRARLPLAEILSSCRLVRHNGGILLLGAPISPQRLVGLVHDYRREQTVTQPIENLNVISQELLPTPSAVKDKLSVSTAVQELSLIHI